jgi:peptidoglycan hydrolase-like protein with peptidoglycan-binding domain
MAGQRIWRYVARVSALVLLLCGAAVGADEPATGRQEVREAQRALALLGLEPGPTDGVLGPRTKSALGRFQRAEGLPVTGTLDERTRSALAARARDHIRRVQSALKETGHDPGPADGVMGASTRAALRRYATAPAPSAPSRATQLIEEFRKVYAPELQQSP